MGVIADDDLRYLADQTGDEYHRSRADDSTAWLMQNLECYPEKTGYGRYGVVSERWCPSDGLVTERYSDGTPYSSWFTYNMWLGCQYPRGPDRHYRQRSVRRLERNQKGLGL